MTIVTELTGKFVKSSKSISAVSFIADVLSELYNPFVGSYGKAKLLCYDSIMVLDSAMVIAMMVEAEATIITIALGVIVLGIVDYFMRKEIELQAYNWYLEEVVFL